MSDPPEKSHEESEELLGQILSIHLTRKVLLSYLTFDQLLTCTLVCKRWCASTRGYISEERLCVLRLDSKGPATGDPISACASLEDANALLINFSTPNAIPFNGLFVGTTRPDGDIKFRVVEGFNVQLRYGHLLRHLRTVRQRKTCLYPLSCSHHWGPLKSHDRVSRDKASPFQVFPALGERIKFKFLSLNWSFSDFSERECPALTFLAKLLKEKREEVEVLVIHEKILKRSKCLLQYFGLQSEPPGEEEPLFPKLKTLILSSDNLEPRKRRYFYEKDYFQFLSVVITHSPNLQKIVGTVPASLFDQGNYSARTNLLLQGKFPCIKKADVLQAAQLMNLVRAKPSRLEVLKSFGLYCKDAIQTKTWTADGLRFLGESCRYSLKKLLIYDQDLMLFPSDPDLTFVNLRTLDLHWGDIQNLPEPFRDQCSLGEFFHRVDFRTHFPGLSHVTISGIGGPWLAANDPVRVDFFQRMAHFLHCSTVEELEFEHYSEGGHGDLPGHSHTFPRLKDVTVPDLKLNSSIWLGQWGNLETLRCSYDFQDGVPLDTALLGLTFGDIGLLNQSQEFSLRCQWAPSGSTILNTSRVISSFLPGLVIEILSDCPTEDHHEDCRVAEALKFRNLKPFVNVAVRPIPFTETAPCYVYSLEFSPFPEAPITYLESPGKDLESQVKEE